MSNVFQKKKIWPALFFLLIFPVNLIWAVSCASEPDCKLYPDSCEVLPLLEGTAMETNLYVISSGKEGPTVMVVGGVHGDEPAGFIAAKAITGWEIDNGTLLVVPRANQEAIAAKERTAPGGDDLNRAYPGDEMGTDTEKIAAAIFAVMQEYEPEWVLDLHEDITFHLSGEGRLGQTLITYPDDEGYVMSLLIIDDINQHMTESLHQYTLREGPAKGSTADVAGEYLEAKAMTVETTMSLPLEERVFQQFFVVDTLLSRLDMKQFKGAENLKDEAEQLILNYVYEAVQLQ